MESRIEYCYELSFHDRGANNDLIWMEIPVSTVMRKNVFEKWTNNPLNIKEIPKELLAVFSKMYSIVFDYENLEKLFDKRHEIIEKQSDGYKDYYYKPSGSVERITKLLDQ